MRLVLVNGLLLVLTAVSIGGVEAFDRPHAALEASVRRYADAVSNADLDAAMAEIAPDQRSTWRDWVRGQLGNIYAVKGIAVHSGGLLSAPTEVTTVLDVNRDYPDEFYSPTTRVPVASDAGRWYLARPLLAPS